MKISKLLNKKRKKSPEPLPEGGLPGTPLNIAAAAIHQTESRIGPEGGEFRSYQGPAVD